MKTRLTLRPGQNGTKKLQRKYGERLLAVRYRYDERRRVRLKTIELIEDEYPWVPPIPRGRDPAERVTVRIEWDELELRAAIKQAGGTWQPDTKTWRVALSEVYELGLESRIVV